VVVWVPSILYMATELTVAVWVFAIAGGPVALVVPLGLFQSFGAHRRLVYFVRTVSCLVFFEVFCFTQWLVFGSVVSASLQHWALS